MDEFGVVDDSNKPRTFTLETTVCFALETENKHLTSVCILSNVVFFKLTKLI